MRVWGERRIGDRDIRRKKEGEREESEKRKRKGEREEREIKRSTPLT